MKDHEQDISLATINEKLIHIERQNERTLNQVLITNGRVRSLEVWRAYLIGGVVVLATILGWVIGKQ